jgi:hypothetical protein
MISMHTLKVTFFLILPAACIGLLLAYQSSSSEPALVAAKTISDSEEVQYWMKQIEEDGGFEAYQLFGDKNSQKSINQTHELAHAFGEALYKVEGIEGVAVCDSNFAFGCYHSFFGQALIDNGIDIITELDEACIRVYGEKGLGCQHGIGHGVLAELGKDNLSSALDACSTLNWQGPIGGCSSGVFMEYNLSTMGTGLIDEYSPDATYFPCTKVSQKYQQACYFEMPALWVQQLDRDYQVVGELCAEVSDEISRQVCYRGVGNIVAGTSDLDPELVITACAKMPNPEGIALCTEGAVWIFSNEKELGDTWKQLCQPLVGVDRERCLKNNAFI